MVSPFVSNKCNFAFWLSEIFPDKCHKAFTFFIDAGGDPEITGFPVDGTDFL
jgi:hypothetical protein